MTENEMILIEQSERVCLIRLNRPEVMNALNRELLIQLMDTLAQADANPATGAMVITGNEKAFAAGADIQEMAQAGAVEMFLRDQISLYDAIQKIRKPVIAAVSGWCLGGGSELAMSCDMIVASETARFGQPEINLGVIPGAGGTQRLTRAVGKALAMEMVLNNRHLNAEEALRLGLVNRVLPVDQYLEAALKLAAEIASRAPLALRLAKEAINKSFDLSLGEGLQHERRAFYFLFNTKDQKEGMQAFLEKRKPNWSGE